MNIKTTIGKSPFGGEGTYTGQLGMINFYLHQLESYFEGGNHSEHIVKDIKGYMLILASNSENNAVNFVKLKQEAIRNGNRYSDNLAVIEALKQQNKWE